MTTCVTSLAVAAVMGWCWTVGHAAWPEDREASPDRIGADPAAVERSLAGRERVRVAVIGDVQNGTQELRAVLRDVRAAEVDLVLLLGDVVNRGEEARFAALRSVLRAAAPRLPVLAVPGNHDLDANGSTAVYERWVGPAVWSAAVAGHVLIGLDDAAGRLSAASKALLRANSGVGERRILVAHRPLAPLSAEEEIDASDRMDAVAAAGPPAELTLCGHRHESVDLVDVHGTRHVVVAENCDRPSVGEPGPLGWRLLVLERGKPPAVESREVARPRGLDAEVWRLAVTGVYPLLRRRPVPAATALAACLAVAAAAALVLLRR